MIRVLPGFKEGNLLGSASPVTAERVFEALAAFLGRYWVFLLVGLAAVTLRVRQIRRWWKRTREMLDPALTADWMDRKPSFLRQRVTGVFRGRAAMLRRFPTMDRSREAIVATLQTSAPGRFILEAGGRGVFQRVVRIGAPPDIELIDPADRLAFRVRTRDRSATDRLLADPGARAAISNCLRDPTDEIELKDGRLRVHLRFPGNEALAPRVREAFAALAEMSRVLG